MIGTSISLGRADIALLLLDAAKTRGMELRLFGSLACWILCTDTRIYFDAADSARERDIDFFNCGATNFDIQTLLVREGFKFEGIEDSAGTSKMRFQSQSSVGVDIYGGRFRFSHSLALSRRICSGSEGPTLSVSHLLLSKLQIAKFEDTDKFDVAMLATQFGIGATDEQEINAQMIASTAAKDWGLWFDVQNNIHTTQGWLQREASFIPTEMVSSALDRLNALDDLLIKSDKTLRWKARSWIGKRVDWRNSVN
jgi:hypothetical protein